MNIPAYCWNHDSFDAEQYVLDHIPDARCKWYGDAWEVRFYDDRGEAVLLGRSDDYEGAWDDASRKIERYLAD